MQKGIWHTVMSPYDDRYIDVKFIGDVSGSVTIAVEEGMLFVIFLSFKRKYIFLLMVIVS